MHYDRRFAGHAACCLGLVSRLGVYGELLPMFQDEFRAAYARRDPEIVYPSVLTAD